MDARLPDDVAQLADAATGRFTRLGGVGLARRAENDPSLRASARSALHDLGAADLDARADRDQFLAAAVLCRAAGAVVLPWPVIPELLRVGERLLVLIDETSPRVDHGSLPMSWLGANLGGTTWDLVDLEARTTGRLGPFVTQANLGSGQSAIDTDDVARYLTLQCWTILGALESAIADVIEHVQTRVQFGQPLAEFQFVRLSLADTAVALRGLDQLTKLTTWRLGRGGKQEHLADAMALRVHATDTAVAVLRTAHQFYGALGFCDETDLSIIDRHLQPVIRYPQSSERLAQKLVPFVRDGVFTADIA